MRKKETKDNGETEKSNSFTCPPPGHGMSEMMKKCCAGRDRFPDCLTMMKGMMETMRNQPCCKPKKDAAEFEGRKK